MGIFGITYFVIAILWLLAFSYAKKGFSISGVFAIVASLINIVIEVVSIYKFGEIAAFAGEFSVSWPVFSVLTFVIYVVHFTRNRDLYTL